MVFLLMSHVIWYRMSLAILIIFLLQLEFLNAEGAECEHHSESCHLVLHEKHGSISSPHYPLTYPEHTCCSWTVDIPPGYVLVMRVQDVDIEEDANCDIPPCCRHSYLSLPQNSARGSQKICGHNRGRQILSVPSPKAVVKFYTSKVVKGGRGFNLTYSLERESAACLGWDEQPCGGGDSKCYNSSQRCDSVKDCPSGSDETGCGDCPLGELPCDNRDRCYTQQQLCDGKPDCVDFSDEVNCGYCLSGEALCNTDESPDGNKCFNPSLQRCNGKLDCPCGEDEVNCDPKCPGKIVCPNGNGCFTPAELRSDGRACVSSVDVENSPVMGIFMNGKFRCDNGQCISYSLWCNGVDNCGDNSDEQTCIKNSVITAAIMGSLTCGLLLVIAVGCMCRLYSLRLAVSNNYRIHHNERSLTPSRMRVPLPHPDEEFFNREPPPAYSVAVGDCQQLQRLSTQSGRLFTVSPSEQGQAPRHGSGGRRPRRHPSRRRSQRATIGRNSPMTDPAVFSTAQPRPNYPSPPSQCVSSVPVVSTLETSLASQRESMIVSSQVENKSVTCPAAPQVSTILGERSTSASCAVDVNPEGDVSSSSTSTSLSPSHDSMTSSTSLMSYLSGNDDDTQLLVLPSS